MVHKPSMEGRRFSNITVSTRKRRGVVLTKDHQAVTESRTLFPHTRVFAQMDERVLKPGGYQRKLGAVVSRGAWTGMPIFALTLEERETCPSSCMHWLSCYGNNMNWSKRYQPSTLFEIALWHNLEKLQSNHHRGFVVRLHILGDFYSLGYVRLWATAMKTFPALRVFGYTARQQQSEIGRAVLEIGKNYPERWKVRRSVPSPVTYEGEAIPVSSSGDKTALHKDVIVCPAQIDKTSACSTCGLCWADASWGKAIAFINH